MEKIQEGLRLIVNVCLKDEAHGFIPDADGDSEAGPC